MKRFTTSLATFAAAAAILMASPAMAKSLVLKRPNASVVTEGIIVACTFKSTRTAAEILATQVRMVSQPKPRGEVIVKRSFCGDFLKAVQKGAPDFLKAVRARLKANPPANAEADPAVQSARKGKKTETTTTTTSDDTTTTVETTVETTTNDNGSTTITETITIKQS